MNPMFAVAQMRFRAGVAGRLPWLIVLAFLTALTTPWWVGAPTVVEAAAQADRAVLTLVVALAVLVAAVPAAIGLPFDIRRGSANSVLSAPVSRFQVVLGEVLGSGTLACVIALGMAGAGLSGLEFVGFGAAVREPARAYVVVPTSADGAPVELSRTSDTVALPFEVPEGLDAEGTLRVRIKPRLIHQSGGYPFSDSCQVGVARPGQAASSVRAEFGLNVPFTVDVPLGDLGAGEAAELTVSGGQGAWKLRLMDVQIAGPPRRFTLDVMLAMACLAPLLFIASAVALVGAVRFGAPTAAGLVLAVVLLFGAQDILELSARYVVETAADMELAHAGHDHAGHDHGPVAVTTTQIALARATLGVLSVSPRLTTFDRTDALVARRAGSLDDVRRSLLAAVLPLSAFLIAAWLLFRRREMIPR